MGRITTHTEHTTLSSGPASTFINNANTNFTNDDNSLNNIISLLNGGTEFHQVYCMTETEYNRNKSNFVVGDLIIIIE